MLEVSNLFIKSAAIDDIEVDKEMVNLRLRFSSEIRDSQGDLFLKSAWTHPEDVEYFKNKGVIDWNHLSRASRFLKSGSSPAERAEAERVASSAILGVPAKNRGIYLDGDIPTCEARVNAKSPYLAPYIPLLREGFKGLEASAAGGAYKPSGETIEKYGIQSYDRARIDHIAICPVAEAINPQTEVALIKSAMAERLGMTQPKSQDTIKGQESDLQSIIAEFMKSTPIYRTWVAEQLLDSIENGTIAQRFEPIFGFLKSHGFSDNDSHDHAIHLLSLLR